MHSQERLPLPCALISHSIPFNMYVKQACAFDCATKTVTLRLQPRFVKVTNKMLACLSVQDLLREFAKQAFQISVLLPHATQIGPKRLAAVCCCSY
jgi:hypothetical protein